MRSPRVFPKIAAALLVLSGLTGCPKPPAGLDAFLSFELAQARVPGLSACIVKHGEVVWSGVAGLADAGTGAPVTEDTLFMLASVSKTVTATALMQCYERGLIDLDADINRYLSFPVRNPLHPQEPISARMLLSHTASLRDDLAMLESLYVEGDSPIALGDFLREYLSPGGEYFRAGRSFQPWAPGKKWQYSNAGMTLAGYLVEVVSGLPFDQFCVENIFEPLGMNEAAWFLRDLPGALIARPHDYRPLRRDFEPLAHYGYPDYPDGQLRASARSYARLLAAFLGNGEIGGVRILEAETVAEMLSTPFPELDPAQAHGWYFLPAGEKELPGHTGGDRGVSTMAFFDPEIDAGVVILMNGNIPPGRRDVLSVIGDRLLEEAGTL